MTNCVSGSQTFRRRLVEVVDQAQHFAALGPAGGTTGDLAQTFREGLDGTERESESLKRAEHTTLIFLLHE